MRLRPCEWRRASVIVLDPVNLAVMQAARERGIKDFIGGNCTVSLMLMAVCGLLRAGLVEWISAMTYQSASGAGAQNMREMLDQMGALHRSAAALLANPASAILDIDRAVSRAFGAADFPRAHFGAPLAASLIPWIDKDLGDGQSREEWKAGAESNKIMGTEAAPVPVEGICVRVSAMRCHSQALTIKLKRDIPLAEVERLIAGGNSWVKIVPNEREASIRELAPADGRAARSAYPSAGCASSRWAENTCPRLRWAISSCGARPSPCAERCASCLAHA